MSVKKANLYNGVTSFGQAIQVVMSRPSEPAFLSKGNPDDPISFDVPREFYLERYQKLLDASPDKSDDNKKKITKIALKKFDKPNVAFILSFLKRKDMFSVYFPFHRQLAARLIDMFQKCKSLDQLLLYAVYCRDQVNPVLFNYALTIAVLNREDTKDVILPSAVETFPDRFFRGTVFSKAREELTVVPDGSREPILVEPQGTGTNKYEEQRLAYFREDIGININYYNWQLLYPFHAIDRKIVDKDRRGELFYYLHQQILARYNAERLCNGLFRVKRLSNLRDPIKEGYFPKLSTQYAAQTWPPRFENCQLADLNRPSEMLRYDLSDLERWIARILDAIALGYAVNEDGEKIMLSIEKGIDILGNIIQASDLSPNKKFYGDLCNMGHAFIAYCHDADHRFQETYCVMGEPATAMRDPAFYRWHAFLGDILQHHKRLLPVYTKEELGYADVKLKSISVDYEKKKDNVINQFNTFWQQTDVNLSAGLDFAPKGDIFARVKHLHHQPFIYVLQVENQSKTPKIGTVRIFLAPSTNEKNHELVLLDQRLLMIEMDRFVAHLQPGLNTIKRRSTESSMTIPLGNTFTPVPSDEDKKKPPEKPLFCGCGWPQHMLVPKGTIDGKEFTLFAMISNFNDDKVEASDTGKATIDTCHKATGFCGVFSEKYPDKRAMGFPFDRSTHDTVLFLKDFLLPNMAVQDVIIKFSTKVVTKEVSRPSKDKKKDDKKKGGTTTKS